MDRTASNRGLARQLGVSETAVRRAEKAGRIARKAPADGRDGATRRVAKSCICSMPTPSAR